MAKAKTISVFDFMERFPDEESARTYLEGIVWPKGVTCPACKKRNATKWKPRKGHYQCKSCRKVFTVRMGTIFEGSKLPIKKWLYAMYLHQTARKGISSLQLSKEIGCTQKTAWFVLHRLREAYDVAGVKLTGTVEVDETYLGGKEENKHASRKLKAGRGAVGKQAVLGMREREGKTKAMPIAETDKSTLHRAILQHVDKGTMLYTDEHSGYKGIDRWDYTHQGVKHSAKEYVNGMAHTNGIESVWALLKRGFNGTYHNWSQKHCYRYVDEFSFRLNEGNCKFDTILRIHNVCRNAVGKRLTYQRLVS